MFFLVLAPAVQAQAAVIPPVVLEITLALCSDGEDNDGNGLGDLQDPNCTSFRPTPQILELTLALCSDGEDNDGNGVADLQDNNCAPFRPVTIVIENTLALCSNNEDDDGNGLGDLQDPNCAPFRPAPATTTPPTTPPTSGGGGGGTPTTVGPTGGSTGGSGSATTSTTSGSTTGGLTTGTPISTTVNQPAMCPDRLLIKTYLRHGRNNNLADMLRLKSFLNRNLGLKLNVNGTFDMSTFNAVKTFQSKYKEEVLLPWDLAGAAVNLVNNPTGYVYKTTKRKINMLICPGLNLPMPQLP